MGLFQHCSWPSALAVQRRGVVSPCGVLGCHTAWSQQSIWTVLVFLLTFIHHCVCCTMSPQSSPHPTREGGTWRLGVGVLQSCGVAGLQTSPRRFSV